MKNDRNIIIMKLIASTLGFIAFCFALAWIYSPDIIITFKIQMDNNTLEVFRSINYTYLQ